MECGVNFVLRRELEFVFELVYLTDDGEGTNEDGMYRWYIQGFP